MRQKMRTKASTDFSVFLVRYIGLRILQGHGNQAVLDNFGSRR